MRAYAAVAPAKAAARSERPSTAGKSEILRREREWAHFVVGSYSSNRSFSEFDAPAPRERRSDRSSSGTD